MYTAARSCVTAGFALTGAAVIAIGPLAAHPPKVHIPVVPLAASVAPTANALLAAVLDTAPQLSTAGGGVAGDLVNLIWAYRNISNSLADGANNVVQDFTNSASSFVDSAANDIENTNTQVAIDLTQLLRGSGSGMRAMTAAAATPAAAAATGGVAQDLITLVWAGRNVSNDLVSGLDEQANNVFDYIGQASSDATNTLTSINTDLARAATQLLGGGGSGKFVGVADPTTAATGSTSDLAMTSAGGGVAADVVTLVWAFRNVTNDLVTGVDNQVDDLTNAIRSSVDDATTTVTDVSTDVAVALTRLLRDLPSGLPTGAVTPAATLSAGGGVAQDLIALVWGARNVVDALAGGVDDQVDGLTNAVSSSVDDATNTITTATTDVARAVTRVLEPQRTKTVVDATTTPAATVTVAASPSKLSSAPKLRRLSVATPATQVVSKAITSTAKPPRAEKSSRNH